MKENGRKINEIVPEVAEETKERVTDAYIELMLARGEDTTHTADFLRKHESECGERIARLESVSSQVDAFLNHVEEKFAGKDSAEHRRIKEALSLMLKLHINQGDRVANGMPFVAHPLAVAERVLDTYTGADASFVVVAALLHDSIEDQSRLLALEAKLARSEKYDVSEKSIERDGALTSLGHFFGMRSMTLVSILTSPKILETNIPQERKNEIYTRYVSSIFKNDLDEHAAAVIKWADLQENAFIGDLYERFLSEEADGNEEEAHRVLNFYHSMREKYKPVLEMVREFFENVDEEHPLYQQRDDAITNITDVLENQYNLV
ncbi:MAG: hypothetical protein JKX80_02355 [Candidatus Pacebacteria bacterium]|nr:hypothetical protein [Candidatus Paceibacterota bacterium]